MDPASLLTTLQSHAPWITAAVALTAAAAMAATWGLRRARRRPLEAPTTRTAPRARLEDVTTVLAACLATGVAATGMWKFFGDVLDLNTPLQVLLFAFVEVAMVTSALRARRNVRESETHSAGVDGVAVWVFTLLSAVLSASDADGIRQALIRLAAPLVAAWLWERGLAADRRHATGRSGRIHWRLTPERLLVRLGLAEPTGRTASDVDVHRRIARLAKAAKRVRILRTTDAKPRTLRRALTRLDKAMDAAVEHAHLATNPARQQELLAQIALLYHAADLADLTVDAPWHNAPDLPAAVTGPVPPATERPRSEEELVALGFESAKVQTYLADKFGLELATGDITAAMAHTPGSAPAAALRSRLGLAAVPADQTHSDQTTDQIGDRAADQRADHPGDHSGGLVSDLVPQVVGGASAYVEASSGGGSQTQVSDLPTSRRSRKGSRSGSRPAARSVSRSAARSAVPSSARVSPSERLDQAREIDARYRDQHGRPISAEKLAKAMRIGKVPALELVQQIRADQTTSPQADQETSQKVSRQATA
ncbi:hypothetical protein [Actinomadura kijaniata]|uniref:hypothetical protein n=1 Tax=Actinomadura kijaniata TaxID=46161 RepID=UPI0008359677|nr:hypothetical protein [Actinomadura kijaniata]